MIDFSRVQEAIGLGAKVKMDESGNILIKRLRNLYHVLLRRILAKTTDKAVLYLKDFWKLIKNKVPCRVGHKKSLLEDDS